MEKMDRLQIGRQAMDDTNDFVDFVLQERLEACAVEWRKAHPDETRALQQKDDELETYLRSLPGDSCVKMLNYLDELAVEQGEELERYYRFGFQDGIRLMKRIREVSG